MELPNIMGGKTKWIIGLAVGLAVIGFFFMRSCDRKKDVTNSDAVLKPGESEAVLVNPGTHQITLISKVHTKTFTLPSRPSRISLMTADGIKIASPQYGTEALPFMTGIFTLNGGKLGGGLSVFYYKRADLDLGFATNPKYVQDTTAFIGVSTFIYSNTSLMLALDNKVTPMFGLTVRF